MHRAQSQLHPLPPVANRVRRVTVPPHRHSRPRPYGRLWEGSLLPPYIAPLALERRHGPVNFNVNDMLKVEVREFGVFWMIVFED